MKYAGAVVVQQLAALCSSAQPERAVTPANLLLLVHPIPSRISTAL
jgi:hypothetical protein